MVTGPRQQPWHGTNRDKKPFRSRRCYSRGDKCFQETQEISRPPDVGFSRADNSRGEDMTVDRSDEARYLRQKAKQFRELARTYKTEISGKLMEIAQDLESRAENLEKGARRSASAHVQRRFSNGSGNRPRRYPLR
jgi:hypothetical protein